MTIERIERNIIVPGLFITSSRIGDAVMTLSLLEGIRKQSPAMRYVVAADPLVSSLFNDDPCRDGKSAHMF